MSEDFIDGMWRGFVVGAVLMFAVAAFSSASVRNSGLDAGAVIACGPCDSVRTCGGWECRAGAEGWQKASNVKGGE